MEIKINECGNGIVFSDDLKDIIKSSEDITKIVEQMNKLTESKNVADENKIKLYKEVFVGSIGIIGALGIGKLVGSLIDGSTEKKVYKDELQKMVDDIYSNPKFGTNKSILIDASDDLITEIESGIRSTGVIENIKIVGYNPETRLFTITA